MRRILLAVALLAVPLSGCGVTGDDPLSLREPGIPSGVLFTYEIAADGETREETFMAYNRSQGGLDLLAYNLSRPNFSSPFLGFNDRFNPRSFNWSNLFAFPLEPGDEYEATVGGAEAAIQWSEVEDESPLDADRALEGVARTPGGEEVGRFRFAATDPPLLTRIQVDTPDGTEQAWTLSNLTRDADWNQPPTWRLGDWWTYEGRFQDSQGNATVVYTNNRSTSRADQAVLNPREVDDRVLMLPFQAWRQGDKAPQSGFVTSLLSTFWSWPLEDGRTWSGSTSAEGDSRPYRALSRLDRRVPLPDGSVTLAFTVQAFVPDGQEPFAEYRYAPRVDHLTRWRITQVGSERPGIDFSLRDWGERFHGSMEIPQRKLVLEVPEGNRTLASGPDRLNRTFEVPDEANRLQIGSRSFAVHQRGVDPEFAFELRGPNGTLHYERDEAAFQGRRLPLSEVFEAEPGPWSLGVRLGEGVSMIAQVYANWFETRTVDCRSQTQCAGWAP